MADQPEYQLNVDVQGENDGDNEQGEPDVVMDSEDDAQLLSDSASGESEESDSEIQEEFESESDSDIENESNDHLLPGRPMTRSGRTVRVNVRLAGYDMS
jgi:hypothetical protein